MKAALPATALATAEVLGYSSGDTSATVLLTFGVGLAFWQLDKAVELLAGVSGLLLSFVILTGQGRCPIDTTTVDLPLGQTVVGQTAVGVFLVAVIAVLVLASVRSVGAVAGALAENPADWALAGFLIFHLGFFLMRPGGTDPWLGQAEWLLPVVAVGGASLLALGLFLRADITWINTIVAMLLLAAEAFLWLNRPLVGATSCAESSGIVILGVLGFTAGAMPGWIPRMLGRLFNRDRKRDKR